MTPGKNKPKTPDPAHPLVSVYVTNHNYGQYIEQCVNSIMAQSMQDFELIIIDDGSTDRSREIINQWAEHPKVTIIHQQNQGLNVSNNIALRTACGTYIMRVDADDYLDENALLVMTTRLEEDDDLGLVFPDYFLVDAERNVLGMERRHDFENDVSLLDQPAHGACTMIRRSYLLEVGGYDENFRCQDGYELWIKFISKHKVTNINLPLFYYRQHGENLTSNDEHILETRAAIKRLHSAEKEPLRTIAVVPVRGRPANHASLALEPLGDGRVIDGLIAAALGADHVALTVLTTPDEEIEQYVSDRYGKRVVVMDRPADMARLNTGLTETLLDVLEHPDVKALDPQAMVVLSIRYPLVTSTIVEDVINTCRIFDCDSVVTVRPETGKFFRHEGHGMKQVIPRDSFTRLEREALFRNAGGVTLSMIDSFKRRGKLFGERVGQVVVDRRAAHEVDSGYDLGIAQYLATNRPGQPAESDA